LRFALFAKYNYNNQFDEDEMDGICNTNWEEEECISVIGREAGWKESSTKTMA
jgi:hypothetical protein